MKKNTISVQKYVELKAKASESYDDEEEAKKAKKAFESYERSIKSLGCMSTDLEEMRQLLYVATNLDKIKWYIKTSGPMTRRDANHTDGNTVWSNNEQIEYGAYQEELIKAGMPTSPKVLNALLALRAKNRKRANAEISKQRRNARPKKARTTELDTRTYNERYLDNVEKATLEGVNYGIVNEKTLDTYVDCVVRTAMKQAVSVG